MKKKILHYVSYILIVVLYCFIRIPSLLSHSVAYTYDQGRDFIAGANIIITHHIPFIGPTTGINGLFHGSWWYYYLTIPFVIFKGLPIGYYYTNFIIHLISLFILVWFIGKKTNYILAFFTGIFIVFSPYFIFTSLFVGNNIMVLPVLLLFLITNFSTFNKDTKKNLLLFFLNGLLIGFIAEFELSFGLFIIPTYILAHIIFPELRNSVKDVKKLCVTLLGLFIAFAPRILFELKNHFEQTKILLSFLTRPKLYNPKPFNDILHDRIILFIGYWRGIFPSPYWCIIFSIIIGLIFIYLLVSRKKINTFILFLGYLISALFLFSLTYKDNFWGNYYEGIQYIMVIFMIFIISQLNFANKFTKYAILSLVVVFLTSQLYVSVLTNKATPQRDGLAVQEDVMNVILKKESPENSYCVRIYTPPVIPHTYNYLFLFNTLKGKIKKPSSEWVNGSCWFIVEADSYKKRQEDWLQINEPKDAHTVEVTKMKDVEVRYYKILPK